MEHGPVPPHERTWRHPSELAFEEREAARSESAPSATRFAALATGAFGLLVLGVLVFAVTPNQGAAPLAITATTTPAAPATDAPVTISAARGSLASSVRRPQPPDAVAMATPVGDGRQALVTRAAAAGTDGELLDVMVPQGQLVGGRLVEPRGDTYVIELDERHDPHPIADEMPAGDEIVTVLTDPPVEVALDDLAELDVGEGTPVLDTDGELVGLCSHDGEETRLIEVSATPAAATNADR